MPRRRASCSPPTQNTWWDGRFGDLACPVGGCSGWQHGTCEHFVRYRAALHQCVLVVVGRRQVAAHWNGARVRDRDVRAAWLEDDAEDFRVVGEGLGIVGPGQAIGHDVVEGIVANARIGVAAHSGDGAAKAEWGLVLRGLRRVREGTLIGWTVRLFVECRERTTCGSTAAMNAHEVWISPVPARTVLRTVRIAGTRDIIRKRTAQWEPGAERFPVVAPDVGSGVGVAGQGWFDRVLVQSAIREAAHHIVPALATHGEHPEIATPELETPRRTPEVVSLIPATFHEGMIQPSWLERHVRGATDWLDVHIEVHTIHHTDIRKTPIAVVGVIDDPLGKGFRT